MKIKLNNEELVKFGKILNEAFSNIENGDVETIVAQRVIDDLNSIIIGQDWSPPVTKRLKPEDEGDAEGGGVRVTV